MDAVNAARPYLPAICRKDGAQGNLRRRYTLGAWRPVWQCPKCQRVIRKATLGHPQSLMALAVAGRRRPDKRPNARKRGYKKFLETRQWREQSQRIQRRDRYRCRLRFDCCTFRSQTAHHVRYREKLEDTRDEDLVAACRKCNDRERERRITRRVLGG